MNCKPNQLAFVRVPAHYIGSGIEVLNNRVVRTVAMHSGSPADVWQVTPPQSVVIKIPAVDGKGMRLSPGEKLVVDGIPDAWLRPFDPASEPEADIHASEIEVTV